VQNYRLVCPAATLLRDGQVCEACLRRSVPYPGVIHACYRGSRMASAAVAGMLAVHRMAGTWRNKVHTYIAVTEFLKEKLVEGALPAEKITVKPNCLQDEPDPGTGAGGYALFAGRLAPEKGLDTLLSAWQRLPHVPLKIAGDGPLRKRITEEAKSLPGVSFLGFLSAPELRACMQHAVLLVVPSEWYEGFPMTLLEAMACGTPAVVSDLGSLREIVEEDVTGARFRPGDAQALAQIIEQLVADPEHLKCMRARVRESFIARYSAKQNYSQLQAIYRAAVSR
jgi:glycosyltransferase involved in cell wall biosynthesis